MDGLDTIFTQKEADEIKEFVSTIMVLPKEDRAILLANANVLKTRRVLEQEANRGSIHVNIQNVKEEEKWKNCITKSQR